MPRRLWLFTLILFVNIFRLPDVDAGGWLNHGTIVTQDGLEAVFLVDDTTITAIYQFRYSNQSEPGRIGWLIPLPNSPTQVEVARLGWPWWDDRGVDSHSSDGPLYPRFVPPLRPCNLPFLGEDFLSAGDGGHPYIAPLLIDSTLSADEIADWLQTRGYRLDERRAERIWQYAAAGMVFLAVEMDVSGYFGFTAPLAITYTADTITLPLGLMTTSTAAEMPMRIWILGDARYTPQNYADAPIDFSQLYAAGQLVVPYPIEAAWFYDERENTYQDVRDQTINAYHGRAFVTEYAGGNILDIPELSDYPYVTRLYGLFQPEYWEEDPVFVRNPNAPDISNWVDLRDVVDPGRYWGCSTRYILNSHWLPSVLHDPILEAPPAGRDRVLGLSVAYPADWVRSDVTVDGYPFVVFAPQVVDASMFSVDMFGDYTMAPVEFPALVVLATTDAGLSWMPDLAYFKQKVMRSIPYSGSGVVFGLYTTPEDWEQNQALYRAMLAYAYRLPYYLHPELEYTLYFQEVIMAYPTGWIERFEGDSAFVFPEADPRVAVRVGNTTTVLGLSEAEMTDLRRSRDFSLMIEQLQMKYGHADVSELLALVRKGRLEQGCGYDRFPLFRFAHNGRQGYVRFGFSYVIEFSAPDELFADYQPVLEAMAKSSSSHARICG